MNELLSQRQKRFVLAPGAVVLLGLVLSLLLAPARRTLLEAAGEEGAKPKEEGKKEKGKEEKGKEDAGKKEGEEEKGEAATPGSAPPKGSNIDDDYVKENLEKHLHPTKVEFLKDGRVKLIFDFREKKEEHVDIFTPKVGAGYSSPFRWSLSDEEHWSAADGNDIGLRVSNGGMALLGCWFLDDVEAEMTFLNRVTFSQRMHIALFFTNDKGNGIGSNLGTQCGRFTSGKPAGGKGNLEAVVNDAAVKIKLVVRNGTFEAHRNGRSRQSMTYSQKSFGSGRLGFTWGGSIMGFISNLEITGKIDSKKMAKVLQKASRA